MTEDPREAARQVLEQRAAQVAQGPPSLAELYSLEPLMEYGGFDAVARSCCAEIWRSQGVVDAWCAELLGPPPDSSLWLDPWDRGAARQRAMAAPSEGALDRFFARHRHVPTPGKMCCIHVGLLLEISPMAAVEYVAALPVEWQVWVANIVLGLGDKPDLVESVVQGSSSEAAVLALAGLWQGAHARLDKLANESRWSFDDSEAAIARDSLASAWEVDLPDQFTRMAGAILSRQDGAVLLGAWLRHLVGVADQLTLRPDDPARKLARLAIQCTINMIEAAKDEPHIEPLDQRSVVDVVARIVLRRARGRLASALWREWTELLSSEDASLFSCRQFALACAGDALVATNDTCDEWLSTARSLAPIFRRHERGRERGHIDIVVHLVYPALHAAAREQNAELWTRAYEFARRYFLTCEPREDQESYKLPSNLFAGFCQAVGDDEARLEEALGLLPTPQHREWAMGTLEANRTRSAR